MDQDVGTCADCDVSAVHTYVNQLQGDEMDFCGKTTPFMMLLW